MKQGTLVMDTNTGRMNIRFGLEEYYGGLHCGTTMDVQLNGKWVPTRIEMADDWYLVCLLLHEKDNLTVRI